MKSLLKLFIVAILASSIAACKKAPCPAYGKTPNAQIKHELNS